MLKKKKGGCENTMGEKIVAMKILNRKLAGA